MVSSRGHKKRAVTKRAEYFNQIATDFPLHRQVPLVPQYNDPVNTAPQYVYTDFWIPPTFNGISTDKGTFALLGRRSVEVRDGRGRETVFSVYTELQDKPSVLERHSQLKECSVPVHDGGSRYLFHRRLPTAIGHHILQESGLREWTMVKRVSRFHSAEVSRFMDARLLQLLKIYIEDAGALDNVPLVFEDYCMHYMKFHGKQGSRVRILFSKTGSGFPMILGFGDTLGCCFVNGRGLYVGYPDNVTEKKVVIGHTGPYAMPPLHGRREFHTSSVVNDVAKSADCGWHCNGLWRTFMDAGSARHLWYNEMVEDVRLDKEIIEKTVNNYDVTVTGK
ncbi:hypothetical protein EV368DRAFT_70022 [Lentinula lateritia]|nr:hypothetical protein EV368DRAFT_70022 [Lentinula lateritia]